MACQPFDYICRAQAGEFGTTATSLTGGGTGANAMASPWVVVIVGVVILAIVLDEAPKIGGWLLLLLVLGLLLLSNNAKQILNNP